jgi:outer membrane protein assembly complex protein YaeT
VQGDTLVRWLLVLIGAGFVWASAVRASAQTVGREPVTSPNRRKAEQSPVIDSIEFAGLRHISSAAVTAQLSLHSGDRFDAEKLRQDLHTLGRLGWFSSIRVEELSQAEPESQASLSGQIMALLFHFEEEPILSHVEYSGSRLLSTSQIEKLLEEKKLPLGLGKPANSTVLQRVAFAIQSTLNELAHPEASVKVYRQVQTHGTLNVRFEITDGPRLPVRQVRFEGDSGVSAKLLRAQMQNIAPWKALASLRGKDAYTRAAFEEDRQRMLTYYRDHGYPEARVGNARVEKIAEPFRKWFPLPHHAAQSGLFVAIPVHAGPFYHLESVEPCEALLGTIEKRRGNPLSPPVMEQDHAFSQQEVDKLRRFYSLRLNSRDTKSGTASFQSVVTNPIFDPETHSVLLKLNLSDSPPYLVRRLEFQGLHKFNDHFVRRRIPLSEGHPLDEHALEAGLTKLARTGYFKPIRNENIHIQLDDARHTADVSIHLEEIGQQRLTLDGGHAQFGSTLGLAYTVFDLLNHEELLTAKLEGGPESLQLLLGIAKEGVFGTRGSLAFSVFDNVIRPRFTHGVQGPFTNSHSEGINVPWTYALSSADSVGVNYTLSRTVSDQTFGTPSNSSSSPPIDFRSHTSSRSVGTAWEHDTGNERLGLSDSVSGGVLGGDENMLRASGEAARIFRDPVFASTNAWAFRTAFNAVGSYRADMPFYSRLFAGDEFVRGLRTGELGPLAMTPKITPSGATMYAPSYAGSNLLTATNAEYRIPLHNGVEAAGFFDLGSGWLLPNWLGPIKPTLLSGTNGVLHGSTGIQLQWTIPAVQVPFRSYYALNVLRLDRLIPLSNKSLLHAHNRFGAFGWGLGSLF